MSREPEILMTSEMRLAHKSVLVVDHDREHGREVARHLSDRGARVIGPAPTLHYACLIIGRRKLDGAVLDPGVLDKEAYSLIDSLRAQGLPIVFSTDDEREIRYRYPTCDILKKPISLDALVRRVARFDRMVPERRSIAIKEARRHAEPRSFHAKPGQRFASALFAAARTIDRQPSSLASGNQY